VVSSLKHPFAGIEQESTFGFFAFSAVTFVTAFDKHGPDVLFEEIETLRVGGLNGRVNESNCETHAKAARA
jgi:hypothetical protein